jgi:hypothetical protein
MRLILRCIKPIYKTEADLCAQTMLLRLIWYEDHQYCQFSLEHSPKSPTPAVFVLSDMCTLKIQKYKITIEDHRKIRAQSIQLNTCTKILLFPCFTQQNPLKKLLSKKIFLRSSLYSRKLPPFPLK